jgi:MOSC domain-containing protein YiiM
MTDRGEWGITGRVASITVSDGGVPKRLVTAAQVTRAGVIGDRQRNLKYHGGLDRALCVWSGDLIAALQEEGHPVFPGSTGENVAVVELDWSEAVPGVRLRLGEVLAEVTSFAMPCRTIRSSFVGGRSGRISQRTYPGWSRVYARVIEEGAIAVGDPVAVVGAA